MLKKLFLTSFLLIGSVGMIYPSNSENTNLFDYCYSLEKILSENSIRSKKNISGKFKSISNEVAKFGVSKTKGDVINTMLDKYKAYKNSFIIKIIPNKVYCFSGYWVEKFKPGTFELLFYRKSQKIINDYNNFRKEVDTLINEINSDYKFINKQFESFF